MGRANGDTGVGALGAHSEGGLRHDGGGRHDDEKYRHGHGQAAARENWESRGELSLHSLHSQMKNTTSPRYFPK